MKFLIFTFIVFSLISCFDLSDITPTTETTYQPQQLRERTERRPSVSCRSNEQGDQVSISRTSNISSKNAGEYRLSGRCDSNSREVIVSIANSSLDIVCSGGRWSANLDLTSTIQGEDEVSISVEDGSDTACANVKNYFNCPADYIAVPRLDDFTDRDFCVMKYEASREVDRSSRSSSRFDNNKNYKSDEKAFSEQNAEPWIGLSHTQAKDKCRNNGLGYRLIQNGEWQTIARHIEDEDQNWSSGKSSSHSNNFLNYGVLYRSGSSYRSNNRSRESYPNKNWSPNKRSHLLPNGEEIWDMSGGVWEYVEEFAGALGARNDDDEPIFESDGNVDLFGPANHYNEPSLDSGFRNSTLGLGYAYLSDVEDIVIRGGGSSEYDLGIFSVDASLESDDITSSAGFRCVYIP